MSVTARSNRTGRSVPIRTTGSHCGCGSGVRRLGASLLALILVLSATVVAAAVSVEPVAVMTIDDDGRRLNYPHSVFYDPVEDEIYLANGGTSRIVVYGPDFFPGISIGASRGVEAPQGGTVLANGDVYVVQVRNVYSERPRITVLNGAFFVEREIFLDEIPEAPGFSPRKVAINRDGLLYVVGEGSRGVLVLDQEGNFLRRLRPRDRTARPVVEEELDFAETTDLEEKALVEISEQQAPINLDDIPEEFRPRQAGRLDEPAAEPDGLNPVIVNHVAIDSSGKLYLLSTETSKVYVYGPDETFLFSFGSKGGTPGHLSTPKALAIDEKKGLVYVADFMRHSILAYSMTGEFQYEFSGRGSAPGWLNFPQDMTINSKGQLIVADLFNRRVQVLEVTPLASIEIVPSEEAESAAAEEESASGAVEPNEAAPAIPDDAATGEEDAGEANDAAVVPETEAAPEKDTAVEGLQEPRIEETIIEEPQ